MKNGTKPTTNTRRAATSASITNASEDYAEFPGEFITVDERTAANIGILCSLVITNGGYIGISATSDHGSVRLVCDCNNYRFDRRLYSREQLSSAVAHCYGKLRVAALPQDSTFPTEVQTSAVD